MWPVFFFSFFPFFLVSTQAYLCADNHTNKEIVYRVSNRECIYWITMAQSFVINTFGSLITSTPAAPSFFPTAPTPGAHSHVNSVLLPSTQTRLGFKPKPTTTTFSTLTLAILSAKSFLGL